MILKILLLLSAFADIGSATADTSAFAGLASATADTSAFADIASATADALLAQEKKASYRLPFEEGKRYPLTQGNHGTTSHTGACEYAFDFGMEEGTKVCAARGGKVVFVKQDEVKGTGEGNNIKIDHGDGTTGIYMHLKKNGALVQVGEWVEQGDSIGFSGATGRVTGPHLHFQVDQGGKCIPIAFDDVEENRGLPVEGKTYLSKNTPGIPAPVKDELTGLERGARLAQEYGLYGAAYARLKRLAEAKLKIDYKPQAEAKKRMEEIAASGAKAAESDEIEKIYIARLRFKDTPAAKRLEARWVECQKRDDFYAAESKARERCKSMDGFYRALQFELDGYLAPALKHYREIAKLDGEFATKAQARIPALEEKLKPQGGKK